MLLVAHHIKLYYNFKTIYKANLYRLLNPDVVKFPNSYNNPDKDGWIKVVNKKKVNSQTLKLPSGKILKNNERKLFEVHRIKTDVEIAEMIAEKISN